jgi:hypothetical protein
MSRGGGARPSRRSCPEKIYLLMEEKILPRMTIGKMRIKWDERRKMERRRELCGKTGKTEGSLLPTTQ